MVVSAQGGSTGGADSSTQSSPPLTFHGGVDLVVLDVIRLKGKQFSLGLTKQETRAADHAMNVLAQETGGLVLTAPIGGLRSVCGAITRELSNRYTLGYVSTNSRRDGNFRRVSVRVQERPDALARTRSG